MLATALWVRRTGKAFQALFRFHRDASTHPLIASVGTPKTFGVTIAPTSLRRLYDDSFIPSVSHKIRWPDSHIPAMVAGVSAQFVRG
jgi:hypothetical protein